MPITNYVTKEQRTQVIKEYLSSRLTREEFCKQKEISLSSLHRWKTQYQEMQTESLHFLPLTKQRKSAVLTPDIPNLSQDDFCTGEIRIEIGAFKFFIREQNSLPLFRLLLEEVKHLAL